MIRRADVVIARFPYAGGSGYKVRPAVVVQCDRLNQQTPNTVLVMVSSNTKLVRVEPTHFLIDPTTADGASSGLSMPSAARCANLATVPQVDIVDTIGHLSDVLKQKLDACLKAALEIP
jgi:mRNA-degrading endonuclease toxin of MazEF toxin-antitoxin module